MAGELSVRETAARALFGKRWTGMTFGRHPDLEDECREVATAVLAAVADHDGLADTLEACAWQGSGPDGPICREHGPIGRLPYRWADHVADVVRAWLKDAGDAQATTLVQPHTSTPPCEGSA